MPAATAGAQHFLINALYNLRCHWRQAAVLLVPQVAALAILLATETRWVPRLAFLLSWGFYNFAWMTLLRRPAVAGVVSLSFLVLLIALSRLKHEILLMTVNFVDFLLIDGDTFSFLIQIFPNLDTRSVIAIAVALVAIALFWKLDGWRVLRMRAATGAAACFAGLIGLSLAVPSDPWEEFYAENYFSKFMRSSVTVVSDLVTRGVLDSDTHAAGHLSAHNGPCTLTKPPHIILVHDESSFDIRAIPGIKAPPGYGEHFKSTDGQRRSLLVEGAGGPSWYTEYNVLTGLSARSYGRFADFVTRIAAGRVERGLPRALRHCGYKTSTLYPMYGSFLGARSFQMSTGIETFLDSKDLGAKFQDTDGFYLDAAVERIAKERRNGPQFLFVYTAQNHFPWTFKFRPELLPEWTAPGNRDDVDEYLRRQRLSEIDYKAFRERLAREFPTESFLIVRYGDHQPYFARAMIDPKQDDTMLARRVAAADPRFLRTYYAIDTVNFEARDTSVAIDGLDAPYLPLMILKAAGIPLDASFAEQERIFQRCRGLFIRCNSGAEARRFNRLLIDAGLVKGL